MSKHLLLILLLISLAFNLAVAVMYCYSAVYHRPLFSPPGWDRDMRLNRETGFHNIRHGRHWPDTLLTNKDEIRQMRLDFSQSRREFMRELRNAKFDLNKTKAALQKSMEAQTRLEKTLGESLIKLREKMTPEQAEKFFKEMRNRPIRDSIEVRRSEGQPARP